MFFRSLAAAWLLLLSAAAMAQMPTPIRDGIKKEPAFITERGAKVVKVEPAPGGLTAYTAVKDGKAFVVFATPDQKVTIVGVLFDSKTGENLSDAIVERSQQAFGGIGADPVAPGVAPQGRIISGAEAHQPIAEMLFSDAVAGIREGQGRPLTTSYVFFDPRCPYCHALFERTRKIAKAGTSIKWIPVNTLGHEGVPLSVEVLRKGIPALELLSKNRLPPAADPTSLERERIQMNTKFFVDIAKQAGKQAATPTIVFARPDAKFGVVQDDGSDEKAFAAAFRLGKK